MQFNLIDLGLDPGNASARIKLGTHGSASKRGREGSPRRSALIFGPPWTRIYLERRIYLSTYKACCLGGYETEGGRSLAGRETTWASYRETERNREQESEKASLFYDGATLRQFSLRAFSEVWWESRDDDRIGTMRYIRFVLWDWTHLHTQTHN